MPKDMGKKKSNAGRPSKYKPECCEQIIQWAKEGTMPLQWAGKFQVARSTLNYWVEEYKEFSEAWQEAKEIALNNWLERGIGSKDQFELTKAKYFLSIAFRVSETQKIEAKSEVDMNAKVKTDIVVSFSDRDELDVDSN